MLQTIDRERWPDEVPFRWDSFGMYHDPGMPADDPFGGVLVGRWIDETGCETSFGELLVFSPLGADGVRRGFIRQAERGDPRRRRL